MTITKLTEHPIYQERDWRMPAGAFGDSTGPT